MAVESESCVQVLAPWQYILTTTALAGVVRSHPPGDIAGSSSSDLASFQSFSYSMLLGVVWGGGLRVGGAEEARVKGCSTEGGEERGVV